MGKLGVIALIAVPLLARADKPTPAQLQQAGDLVKKAITKSQAGDHDQAIDLYKAAYDIIPQPILLSNIGSEYEQAKKPIQALKYFCKYLDADPTGSNASYAIAKAKAIQIDLGNPPADDDAVCKAPAPPPPPPKSTTLAEPGFEGSGSATTGAFGPTGGPSDDEHPGRGLEYTGVAVGAVGIAGVIAGITFGLEAKSLSDQINNHNIMQPWPSQIDGVPINEWTSQGAAWNRDTYIFAIGGGVAIAAGLGLFIYGWNQDAKPTERATVSVVPTGNGLAAFGTF
ncbi:MAG TPA: tetratricopeptide repeat protein [Kofleriaceae bacterium]|jgi:hypothetical protein